MRKPLPNPRATDTKKGDRDALDQKHCGVRAEPDGGAIGGGRSRAVCPSQFRQSQRLVEKCSDLRDLSAQLPGLEWRRNRRPERDYTTARPPEGNGGGRDLADADLSLAAGRLRLRHFRLQGD